MIEGLNDEVLWSPWILLAYEVGPKECESGTPSPTGHEDTESVKLPRSQTVWRVKKEALAMVAVLGI